VFSTYANFGQATSGLKFQSIGRKVYAKSLVQWHHNRNMQDMAIANKDHTSLWDVLKRVELQ